MILLEGKKTIQEYESQFHDDTIFVLKPIFPDKLNSPKRLNIPTLKRKKKNALEDAPSPTEFFRDLESQISIEKSKSDDQEIYNLSFKFKRLNPNWACNMDKISEIFSSGFFSRNFYFFKKQKEHHFIFYFL